MSVPGALQGSCGLGRAKNCRARSYDSGAVLGDEVAAVRDELDPQVVRVVAEVARPAKLTGIAKSSMPKISSVGMVRRLSAR